MDSIYYKYICGKIHKLSYRTVYLSQFRKENHRWNKLACPIWKYIGSKNSFESIQVGLGIFFAFNPLIPYLGKQIFQTKTLAWFWTYRLEFRCFKLILTLLLFWLSLEFFITLCSNWTSISPVTLLYYIFSVKSQDSRENKHYWFPKQQWKVFSYKAGVYCSVVSQGEVKAQSNLVW